MLESAPTLPAKSLFEITCRKPDQRARHSVEAVVEPCCRHAERTHVVANHDLVLQSIGEIADGPESRRVRRTHELIGDMTAIDVQPKRKIPFDTARAGQRSDAAAYRQEFVEGVLKICREDHLRALALISIRGPGVQEVAHLRAEYPPKKLDLKFE